MAIVIELFVGGGRDASVPHRVAYVCYRRWQWRAARGCDR
jgi:hypothetical protein